MNVLYLETSGKDDKLCLVKDKEILCKLIDQNNDLAESLSEKIEKFLIENNIRFKDLTHLAVFKGPGGFTSLRIGIATANVAAFVLSIPLIEIHDGEQEDLIVTVKESIKSGAFQESVKPFYGKEPNITMPKK